MRYLVIAVLSLAAITAALGQDPGYPEEQVALPAAQTAQQPPSATPVVGPREGETLPNGRLVGTPQGELPATMSDINALRKEWQQNNATATAAQRRGDGQSFTHHRQRANALALQISALSNRVGYLEQNPLGGTPVSHQVVYDNLRQVGFLTQGDAGNLYAPKAGAPIQPALVPAFVQDQSMPAEPARRNGNMSIAMWVLVGVLVAGFTLLLSLGIPALNRLAAARRQQGMRTLADPPAAGETATHRNEISAPNAGPVEDASEVEGWRVSGPWGTASGERYRTRPRRQSGPADAPASE